jgi:hypothetical protein
MTRRSLAAWCLASAIGLSAACDAVGRAASAVGELVPVHQAVQARVDHGTVRIKVDDRVLTALVFNSPLRGLPADQKTAKARELATAAYQAYANRARIARVRIVFAVEASVPFVRYDDRRDAHDFDASELRAGAPAASGSWRSSSATTGSPPRSGPTSRRC